MALRRAVTIGQSFGQTAAICTKCRRPPYRTQHPCGPPVNPVKATGALQTCSNATFLGGTPLYGRCSTDIPREDLSATRECIFILGRRGHPHVRKHPTPGSLAASAPRSVIGARRSCGGAVRCLARISATAPRVEDANKIALANGQEPDFEGKVPQDSKGERLDAYLVAHLPQASRSKIQTSIKEGLVLVNGRPQLKPSFPLRGGESVTCSLPPPPPSDATPEDIPLEIVYEDAHLIVVNKRADMVVHPAAGHSSGTLVNALLFHCDLPSAALSEEEDSSDELDDDAELDADVEEASTSAPGTSTGGAAPHVRPGIVHRLDKGTSGLLVVAKDERSLKGLSKQFKDRTVKRSYLSILCGVPDPPMARIEAPVGRDPRDRKRQAVIEGLSIASKNRSRHAASKYRVKEWLAGGACGLVEWRLETGRTHQIRVHAKHVGHPVLGDETYGCTPGLVLNSFQRTLGPPSQSRAKQLLSTLKRPLLHAKTLGFVHPWTEEELMFTSDLPLDFSDVLDTLRDMSPERLDQVQGSSTS